MWIYLALVIIVIYAVYKERQALGCPTVPNGTDCDNANGKAIKGTQATVNDSNTTLLFKINKASEFTDKWVIWRLALILSMFCVLTIFFILYQRFPEEQELFVGMFVITALVYFTFNFYQFHLMDYIKQNIQMATNILGSRI